jgi:hypothetical protein
LVGYSLGLVDPEVVPLYRSADLPAVEGLAKLTFFSLFKGLNLNLITATFITYY